MGLIPIILFVLSASLDNFVVALAYGSKNIKIGFLSNLVIAFISASGTFISMLLGSVLINVFSIKHANLLGAFVLLILGVYFIFDYKKTKDITSPNELCSTGDSCPKAVLKFPEVADKDKSGTIELSESFFLATVLALNNFALGIAASITGLDTTTTSLSIFFFSLLLIPLGLRLSTKFFNKLVGDKGGLLSGGIILFLALIEALN